ncbi:MAG TPA: P-II family nitrogen regulator [Nitrospiria bacterium]|nr:P-II family nitrogen regulator [Candidatus Manganitrophaceae bacterium]HIL35794.1 P-II family nitrogen regulator [Candidatus Manganitrophaceae bacterium]
MKMIRAIIRTEQEEKVLKNLEDKGLYAVTKIPVLGRGQQRGIQVGRVSYSTLAKLMLILFVEEEEYEKALEAIESGADTDHPGDGKIFVQEVSEAYNIRTGIKDV